MRVVHLDHSGLPGGGQLGLKRLLTAATLLHTPVAIFLTDGPVADELAGAGVEVVTAGMHSGSILELIRHRRRLASLIRQQSPDVVVANSYRAAFALALARPGTVNAYYLRQDHSAAGMGRVQRALLWHGILRAFPALIANSEWTLSTVPERLRRPRSLHVVTPISGIEDFLEVGRTENPDPDVLRIGWVGRVARWKGLHVLQEALQILESEGRHLRVEVAGGTFHEAEKYAEDVVRNAEEAAYDMSFLGHVDDIPGFLSRQDVLVHTSIVPEPFGQVVVQGMAAGLPVVATDAGGPSAIIRNGVDGVLVPGGDAAALADALRELSDSSVTRHELGATARETARATYTAGPLVATMDRCLLAIRSEVTGSYQL